jgi:hypothetical protein
MEAHAEGLEGRPQHAEILATFSGQLEEPRERTNDRSRLRGQEAATGISRPRHLVHGGLTP